MVLSHLSHETFVFVYGNLLRGLPDHPHLGSARHVLDACTRPEFDLIDFGEFPALVQGGSTAVRGEVYAVDVAMLESLDELEDCPAYTCRGTVTLEDGSTALAYLMERDRTSGFGCVPDGDWRSRCLGF